MAPPSSGIRVAVLHDVMRPQAPADEQDTLVQAREVAAALARLGHRVTLVPFARDAGNTVARLERAGAELVFNLVESIRGEARLHYAAPALLEILGLPFTGAGTAGLICTSDKPLAKRLLAAAGLPTPELATSAGELAAWPAGARAIVKPACENASVGIDAGSVVQGPARIAAELDARRRRNGGDWFAERFIDGRELNVSLLRGDYQVFLHRGHMKHFITVDSEKPGKKLIVAGGRNNRDSIDVVAVLDPERMHGMTPPPERSGLEIPGFENNVAMHYIAIPASDLREVQSGIGRPYIEKIRRDDKGRVRISVLENSDVLLRNAILYYLDSAWRCAEIQYSDAYISAFRLGLGGVDITERLERQTQRLKREFRYYTGSGFSDSPVINAGYLAGGGKPPASGASLVQD